MHTHTTFNKCILWPLDLASLLTCGSFCEQEGEAAQCPVGHFDGSQSLSAHKVQSTRSSFISCCTSSLCWRQLCVRVCGGGKGEGGQRMDGLNLSHSRPVHRSRSLACLSVSPGCRLGVLDSTDGQIHVTLSGRRRRSSSNTRNVNVSSQIGVAATTHTLYVSFGGLFV